ncbi:SRPBCC family protein [Cohnella suwonensis]|uniref:SRPBCC family protein n=1 Tax=Cohnella suwonensis TaxID=696072 RepID=A0ABW0LSG8_9BACL
MWKFEHAVTTKAKAATIWSLYSDIPTWVLWDSGKERVSLDGPFAVGAHGLMQPKGKSPLAFEITEIVPLKGFTDVTDLPDAGVQVRFVHVLEPVAEGTRITHVVTIEGPGADVVGPQMIQHFTKGVPHTIESLAALALEREGQHAG